MERLPRYNERRRSLLPGTMTRLSIAIALLLCLVVIIGLAFKLRSKSWGGPNRLQFSFIKPAWGGHSGRSLPPEAVHRLSSDETLEGKIIESVVAEWGPPSNVTAGRNARNETQYRFDYVNPDYVVFLFVRNGKVTAVMSAKKSEWPAWQHLKRNEGASGA